MTCPICGRRVKRLLIIYPGNEEEDSCIQRELASLPFSLYQDKIKDN